MSTKNIIFDVYLQFIAHDYLTIFSKIIFHVFFRPNQLGFTFIKHLLVDVVELTERFPQERRPTKFGILTFLRQIEAKRSFICWGACKEQANR